MYDLYACSPDDRCRFLLGRHGSKTVHVIGLNPSTATQEKSDTTVAKVEQVARRAGYDGFAMLNLYPVRATEYHTLPLVPDPKAHARNLSVIDSVVSAEHHPVIWAAWGESILARPFFVSAASQLATRLQPLNPRWLHYGHLTDKGHPRHPSRLSYAWSFTPFDIHAYVKTIGT